MGNEERVQEIIYNCKRVQRMQYFICHKAKEKIRAQQDTLYILLSPLGKEHTACVCRLIIGTLSL